MKTIHIFLTIPSLTIATLRNMEQNLKHLESKFSRQRFGGAPSFLQASIAQINHYGCWCFFQDDHHLAKGPPQNEVDKFCKILHNGYECAMIDSGDKNLPACSPWKVDYNSSTMIGNTAQEVETNCMVSNAGYCEQRACIVENFFILNIFSVFFTSTPFDPSLKHDLGFDYAGECLLRNDLPSLQNPGNFLPKPDNSGNNDQNNPLTNNTEPAATIKPVVKRPKSCCGCYPNRFVYHFDENKAQCCGKETYNPTFKSCCHTNNLVENGYSSGDAGDNDYVGALSLFHLPSTCF